MPAPGDASPVYRTLPPWTEEEMAFRASIFGVSAPRSEWTRARTRIVMRGARGQVEFYRGSHSFRWEARGGVAPYLGTDGLDALAAITGGRHEPLLPRSALLQTTSYQVEPPTVTRVGPSGVGVTRQRGRSLGARFDLSGCPLWRMRLRVELDPEDRPTSLFFFSRDIAPEPLQTVPTLTLPDLTAALHPGLHVAAADIEGPGYLLAAPDRAQPCLAPVYRISSNAPNQAWVRFCSAFSRSAPFVDPSWSEPYGGDLILV